MQCLYMAGTITEGSLRRSEASAYRRRGLFMIKGRLIYVNK